MFFVQHLCIVNIGSNTGNNLICKITFIMKFIKLNIVYGPTAWI